MIVPQYYNNTYI